MLKRISQTQQRLKVGSHGEDYGSWMSNPVFYLFGGLTLIAAVLAALSFAVFHLTVLGVLFVAAVAVLLAVLGWITWIRRQYAFGKGGMMEFANASTNNILELSNQLTMLTSHLRISNETYDGYIINHIIPNLKKAVEDLQAINPNATIIIQSIYNPLELSPEYLTNRYGANSTYANMLGIVRTKFAKVMKNYKDCIDNIATSYDNVKVADILSEFDALKDGESQSDSNPGHAYYFIDNQPAVEIKDADIHPNQKGHLAIAAKILDTIGIYHDDNGLLSSVYESIADKADYPEVPLATFTKVAGNYSTKLMGDVNGDGIVNAVDASAILTYFAITMTDQTPTMKFDKSVADYNNDGIINSIDASAILTYYANSMITK